MESYKNLKKGTKVGLIISTVLLAAVLVNNAFSVVQAINDGIIYLAIMAVIDAVMCVVILLYAFYGYMKPHGNMLRLAFLAYAIFYAFRGTLVISGVKSYLVGDIFILVALIIAYVAGRLNKIEKNKFILFFAGLLLLANILIVYVEFPTSFGFWDIFGSMTPIITFTALSFAYIARYEEHKAAGLEDAN